MYTTCCLHMHMYTCTSVVTALTNGMLGMWSAHEIALELHVHVCEMMRLMIYNGHYPFYMYTEH